MGVEAGSQSEAVGWAVFHEQQAAQATLRAAETGWERCLRWILEEYLIDDWGAPLEEIRQAFVDQGHCPRGVLAMMDRLIQERDAK